MDTGRSLKRQRMMLLRAFLGLVIGVGAYQGAKRAFNQLDGLTNTVVINAAVATTFLALLVFAVIATLWTRHSRRNRPTPGRS
jgi:TctA family transporter